ncbi:MAG: cache domain-containing protein [Dehalococcoidia bacterium]|nr:cache domain-containing protein [Dehalococcoidia bacterium]
MWNTAVSMVKRIRIGLLFKMWLLCLAVTFLYDIYFVYYALPGFQTRVFNYKREEVQCGADVALGVLNSHYALETAGILTTSEAQSRALAELNSLRYGEDSEGTFWVSDYQPVLLADPAAPTLVNTNVSYIIGADGESVFGRMADICRNNGGGFYQFRWEYNGDARNKLSYVAAFEPWGWVVGTGVYTDEVMADYGPFRNTIGIAFGVIGFISLLFFWIVTHYLLSKPLNSLVRTSEALAVGDVEQKIDVTSNDEIGRLAASQSKVIEYMREMSGVAAKVADGNLAVEVRPLSEKDAFGNAFSQLVERQRDLIGKVKLVAANVSEASRQLTKASEQTAQATQQIATTIQQVARGTAEQSNSLQQTANSVEQLSGAISQIAAGSQEQARGVNEATGIVKRVSGAIAEVSGNARVGMEAWQNTASSAAEGARMTHETVAGMGKVKSAMDLVSVRVTDLGERSGEIGKIVATIDDIASQTNLLALNAAIEAARAGEQGRGFAVVADEVRKLAERSSLATKEIASIVDGIRTGVAEAVSAMQQGSRDVEVGYKLATDAGGALDNILDRSRSVAKQVERISVAAQDLQGLSNGMVEAIDRINRIVEQNAAATEQMTQSSGVVSKSVEATAGVAEENSAASQQVSASVEEMSAQVEETLAAAQSLADMSEEMERAVAAFNVGADVNGLRHRGEKRVGVPSDRGGRRP